MKLEYKKYPFSSIPGWSISRYETFDKCKRQYYYQYYSKHVKDVPGYKINKLKNLTSEPLESGKVVHDVIEKFLERLRKSTSDINTEKFYKYAYSLLENRFSKNTFLETYYNFKEKPDYEKSWNRVKKCLDNFIKSPVYNWIFMKAVTNREDWLIEPGGYGETRLNGIKAYCKMDFLFPVDGEVFILDWKTGKKDEYKHTQQLLGYAAATSNNFNIPEEKISPSIVYLYPEFSELVVDITKGKLDSFFKTIQQQYNEILSYCSDPENNIPLNIENFQGSPSPYLCRNCKFQEICPYVFKENEDSIEDF